mgnify:CR=1 FL=1
MPRPPTRSRALVAACLLGLASAPADAAPKRIFLLRPLEEQALAMMHAKSVTIDDVCRHADGWEGITQADLLGPELGSQDEAVDFAPEIFSEFVRDRADLMAELVTRLAEAINAHFARRADTAKN